MKNYLLLLAFIVLSLTTFFAQDKIQWSAVREQNSNKRTIPNAQVIFSDALPASSDQNGKLRLAFTGKKPGDLVFITSVAKEGFELVNGKELQVLKISNMDQLGIDIILAKAGTVDAAKKEYYAVSDKALLAGFNKQKQALQTQIQKAQISQQEYLDKLEDLQDQYDRQRKSLDALAEKFARVNFDDVSKVYKEALELFKAGKIDEAIQKLEAADFLNRSEKRIQERTRIENAIGDIADQKAENEKGIQEDIKAILHQARIYVIKGQALDATPYYYQLLLLDNKDLEILQECADFYQTNDLIENALSVYPLIIAHPNANERQKIKADQDLKVVLSKKK